jgi:hypothetical protein
MRLVDWKGRIEMSEPIRPRGDSMTPESINIAIINRTGILGDFYHDLNACHEAERLIADMRMVGDYWDQLDINGSRLAMMDEQMTGARIWAIIHATAPQRCEGMLRVWGLWEESK